MSLVRRALPLMLAVVPIGCSLNVSSHTCREAFPGLGDLAPSEITGAFAKRVELAPPISAGLLWVDENTGARDKSASRPLGEYERTGVLRTALIALRHDPFANVAALPMVDSPSSFDASAWSPPSELDHLRAACAEFQLDVALVLRTGIDEDSGYNAFAIGYLPLVTAPLFPGTDLAAAAGAELFAVDVRTGVPLACGRGRDIDEDHLVFPWQSEDRRRQLREIVLGRAIAQAAEDLIIQVNARLAAGRSPQPSKVAIASAEASLPTEPQSSIASPH